MLARACVVGNRRPCSDCIAHQPHFVHGESSARLCSQVKSSPAPINFADLNALARRSLGEALCFSLRWRQVGESTCIAVWLKIHSDFASPRVRRCHSSCSSTQLLHCCVQRGLGCGTRTPSSVPHAKSRRLTSTYEFAGRLPSRYQSVELGPPCIKLLPFKD